MFGPVVAVMGAVALATWIAATGFFTDYPADLKHDKAIQLQELRERALYPCSGLDDPACKSWR